MVRKYFVLLIILLGIIHTCTSTFRAKKQSREWSPMVTVIWHDKQWISMNYLQRLFSSS